jgi:phosphatidylglycerophosphatase A
MKKRLLPWALATWFGCGLVPIAPGTAGTLGALPLYFAAASLGRGALGVTIVIVTSVGIWAASRVAHDLRQKDPQIVVIDEVAGMLVTMLPMSVVSFRAVAVGFVLFRLFDIIKPWPVQNLEKLPGGWGIVLDDVAAGFMGAVLVAILRVARVLP